MPNLCRPLFSHAERNEQLLPARIQSCDEIKEDRIVTDVADPFQPVNCQRSIFHNNPSIAVTSKVSYWTTLNRGSHVVTATNQLTAQGASIPSSTASRRAQCRGMPQQVDQAGHVDCSHKISIREELRVTSHHVLKCRATTSNYNQTATLMPLDVKGIRFNG